MGEGAESDKRESQKSWIEKITGTAGQVTLLVIAVAGLLSQIPDIAEKWKSAKCAIFSCRDPQESGNQDKTISSDYGASSRTEAPSSAPPSPASSNPTPGRAQAAPVRPESLPSLIKSISEASKKEAKDALKQRARMLMSDQIAFSTYKFGGINQTVRTTQSVDFVDYNPVENLLKIIFKSKIENNSNGPWTILEDRTSAVDIYLGRLDKLQTSDNSFSVDGPMDSFRWRAIKEWCSSSYGCSRQYPFFVFQSTSDPETINRIKKAIITIMYQIDGRPPK